MRVDYPQLESLHAKATRDVVEAFYEFLIAPVAKLLRRKS